VNPISPIKTYGPQQHQDALVDLRRAAPVRNLRDRSIPIQSSPGDSQEVNVHQRILDILGDLGISDQKIVYLSILSEFGQYGWIAKTRSLISGPVSAEFILQIRHLDLGFAAVDLLARVENAAADQECRKEKADQDDDEVSESHLTPPFRISGSHHSACHPSLTPMSTSS
jgi:hypothetical protein